MTLARLAALAVGLALALLPRPAAAELLAEKRDWSWVESPSFRLLTDGATRAGADVVEELERFRSVVAALLPKLELNEARPTYVFLFRDERGFRPYLPASANGKPLAASGLFWWSSEANYILMPALRNDEFLSTVYHEYFHYLVANNTGELPLWINEGMAEFYSTFRFRARDAQADIGRVIPHHVQYLSRYSGLTLRALLEAHHGSPEYNENARRGAFYAKAWLLTHWLTFGGVAQEGALGRYLNTFAGPAGAAGALEQAVGLGLDRIEIELNRYRQRPTFSYRSYPVGELPAVAAPATRPARTEEALALLAGYLSHHESRRAELAEHVAALERVAPDSAAAALGRARLAEAAGDPAAAQDALLAARRVAPDDVEIAMRLARAVVGSVGPDGAPPARLAEGRDAAAFAVERAPRRLEAWNLLLYLVRLEPGAETDRLALAERAAAQFPDRLDLRLDCAYLRRDAGDLTGAERLAGEVRDATADEGQRLSAAGLHAELVHKRAWELANAGAWEEAEALLAAEVAGAPEPLRLQLEGSLATLRGQIVESRSIASYNAAVELTRAGKYREAADALRTLLERGAGPAETAARELLEQLDGYLARRSASGSSRAPGS